MTASRTRLLFAFAIVYLIWGSTYLAIRITLESMPPFLMGGARFVLAGTLMLGLMGFRGFRAPTLRQWGAAAIVGAFLLVGGNGGVVWAEQTVPSGLVALLVAIEPLWVVLIDWARPSGTRPRAGEVGGLVLGFVGVGVLLSPTEILGGGVAIDLVGATVVVFAAASWAVGSVYSRHAATHQSPFVATGMKMLTGGMLLLVVSTFAGEWSGFDPASITLRSWLAFGYLVIFGALIAFTAYIWLLKNTTLARASTYAYVNPVVAVFLGWLLIGEPLSPRVLLAMSIILAGVVVVVRSHRVEVVSGAL